VNTLSLIKKPFGPCPPEGYRYVFPTDGHVSHAWTYTDWIQDAINHLQANKEEIPPDLAETMEHQLCLTLPPGWCNYDDDNRPRATTVLYWGDIQAGLETFARIAKEVVSGRFHFASQTESERRALICSRCYLNTNVSGCSACHKLAKEVVGSRTTKYDFALKACAACKCLLKAKVHFPIESLDIENERMQALYPEHCWLKHNGPNYLK
jgi:hypothetical protein